MITFLICTYEAGANSTPTLQMRTPSHREACGFASVTQLAEQSA